MRWWIGLVCMFALAACTSLESRRPNAPGDIGILGSAGASLVSGRPATQPQPSIARGADDRERQPYIELGSSRGVEASTRKPVEIGEGGATISLNFVDVELQEFVRVMFDEILKETVVVDPSLKGRITIRTSGPVTRTAALDLIRQSLQASGASLSQSGTAYRVTARNDQRGARRLGESIRIVPVNYIEAEEAKLALAAFTQTGVEIGASKSGRYLTIAGPPPDLDNMEQALATLDVDQMKGMSMALLPLREAGAAAVANELTQVFAKEGGESRSFRSMPVARMNAVLIISSQPRLISEARKWVARLDRADGDARRIYVYPVQNRRAPDIAKTLTSILGRTKSAQANDTQERGVAPQLTPVSNGGLLRVSRQSSAPAAMTADDTEPAGDSPSQNQKAQNLRITADLPTNSIVFTGSPEEWRVIEAALRRLDVLAPQILIEATIAEVRLNASLRHGVRWFFNSGQHGVALNDGSNSSSSTLPGFNYVFGAPNARVSLNALEELTDVEIVSSPALTVLDNQTAKLQIGDQVPIATRSSQSISSPDAPIMNDIEFKDTGVILSVTPHVNASGLVVLEITQEVSDVVPTTTSNLNSPTIRQRRINSTVAVHSGTEIVLGGLIGTSRNKGESGIPLLMEIPVVGNAFKSQAARGADRSELLILLRPTVMGNRLDIENVTREIKSRMRGATGAIYR